MIVLRLRMSPLWIIASVFIDIEFEHVDVLALGGMAPTIADAVGWPVGSDEEKQLLGH